MKNIITDLHTHITDGYDLVWNPKIPFIGGSYYGGIFNSRKNVPKRILERCFSRGQDTLVGLINFCDHRAEEAIEEIKKYSKDKKYNLYIQDSVLTIVKGSKTASFITGQEIATDKGHVLIVGAGKNIDRIVFEDVLKEAKEEYNALIFGDHILSPNGLKRKDIEEHREYFTAINVWDGNFGKKYAGKQEELAQSLEIPIYSASDSHTIKAILSSATIFEELNFSTPEKLKESVRAELRNKNLKLIKGSNGIGENYRHGVSVLIGCKCLEKGIMKRETSKT